MKKVTKENIFVFESPENPLPVIFDSPHSGFIYPTDFNHHCPRDDLRRIEDTYVNELFENAPECGAMFLHALFPRSYIDANRAKCDIDENLFDGDWPNEPHGEINPSARSDSGIGLIARLLKPGQPIYNRYLPPDEIMHRIKTYYEPYHDTLCTALENAYYNHGKFWHINCHSMPNNSAYPKHQMSLVGGMTQPSDIVLGDRDGTTCDTEFLHILRDFWKNKGYRVTINDPFKGVELIHRYSQPTRGRNSLQIEINRSLYMDETTGEKSKAFEVIKSHCTEMMLLCTSYAKNTLTRIAAD
ncbi:MAG: N-formylglutamate amidohydrolase [Alphaproteobacteria bacterium]